jgi:hypothetical protein
VLDGALDLAAIARGPDDEGRRKLLDVPGLGPWSVDIYYLMALRRPDVWPRGDLALAAALRDVKGLRALPSHERQQELSRAWTPWRSVAARILWRTTSRNAGCRCDSSLAGIREGHPRRTGAVAAGAQRHDHRRGTGVTRRLDRSMP